MASVGSTVIVYVPVSGSCIVSKNGGAGGWMQVFCASGEPPLGFEIVSAAWHPNPEPIESFVGFRATRWPCERPATTITNAYGLAWNLATPGYFGMVGPGVVEGV